MAWNSDAKKGCHNCKSRKLALDGHPCYVCHGLGMWEGDNEVAQKPTEKKGSRAVAMLQLQVTTTDDRIHTSQINIERPTCLLAVSDAREAIDEFVLQNCGKEKSITFTFTCKEVNW